MCWRQTPLERFHFARYTGRHQNFHTRNSRMRRATIAIGPRPVEFRHKNFKKISFFNLRGEVDGISAQEIQESIAPRPKAALVHWWRRRPPQMERPRLATRRGRRLYFHTRNLRISRATIAVGPRPIEFRHKNFKKFTFFNSLGKEK